MALVLVQSANATGAADGSGTTVTLSATTAGNVLIAACASGNSNNLPTGVTLPSPFTLIGPTTPTNDNGRQAAWLAYATNISSGLTSFNFKETGASGAAITVYVYEISGLSTSVVLNDSQYFKVNTGTNTDPITASATALRSGDLIVCAGCSNLGTPSITPHTLWNSTGSAFLDYSWAFGGDTTSGSGSQTATFTKSTGNTGNIVGVAILGLPVIVRSVPQSAAVGNLGIVRSVPQVATVESGLVRLVPQLMQIFPDTIRAVPQHVMLQPIPRSIPQGIKVGGIRRAVPQFMLIATETIRHVPQHLALSPFVRSVPQHMQLSPANMRSITQQMRLRITLIRSVPQHFLPSYGGTTQSPRSVPQTAVLKLKGSHKPPKTNNRDIPQFLLASPKPRGVPQFGAISKVGITRFVSQAMTISLSAGVRSVPQSGAAGSVGTIRSVLQSVVAKKLGAIHSVPQFALMNTVAGRFIRSVPQHTVVSEPGTIRSVPQFMVTDRTAPLSRTVLQNVLALEKLIRPVTQHATLATTHIRSVPEHAVLKATNIRSVPQRMQAGGPTVSQRGFPVVSIGKIPVVVVPSEPEVELSIK